MTADSVLRRSRFVFEEPGEKQVIIITDIRHEVLMRCATSSDVSLKVRLNFRLEKLRRVIWQKQGKVCTCNQMFKNIWFMVKRPWNKALYGDNVLKRTDPLCLLQDSLSKLSHVNFIMIPLVSWLLHICVHEEQTGCACFPAFHMGA